MANYEKIIKDFFFEIHTGVEISAEKYDELSKINSLIHDLHPDLKNQLLDIAGRQIALQPEDKLSLDNLIVFSQEMLEEMTNLMKAGESRISSTLIMLMQKMQDTEKDIEIIGQTIDEPKTSKSDIKNLLKQEKEEYVPEDYDKILKESAMSISEAAMPDEDNFPLSEHFKSIADDNVNLRICELLLALMDEEITEKEYLTYSSNLSRIIPELITAGQFAYLTDVTETLHRHGRGKSALRIRQMAVSALNTFSEAETVKMIKSIIMDGTTDVDALKRFLVTSGPHTMNWLFDLYLDKSAPPSLSIVNILQAFGRMALDEAVKMLFDENPQKVVRLLMLIRAFNDRYAVPAVKGLFEHQNLAVRKELIKTFLQFDDYTAIDLMKKGLNALDREEVMQSINLICTHQINELMEDVMALLTTFFIREKNVLLNEWIVTQIGATGNPAMIPYLERIAAKRMTLTPARLYRIKEILYNTLRNYPRESVQKMLEKGKRSGSKKIKTICTNILTDRV